MPDTTDHDLLPCPFCGGQAEHGDIEAGPDHPDTGGHFVQCKTCGASTNLRFACGDDPKPILRGQWNARVPSPATERALSIAHIAAREVIESEGSKLHGPDEWLFYADQVASDQHLADCIDHLCAHGLAARAENDRGDVAIMLMGDA